MADRTLTDILRSCANLMSAHMHTDGDEARPRHVILDLATAGGASRACFSDELGNETLRPASDPAGHDHALGPATLVYDVSNDSGWDGTLGHTFVVSNHTLVVFGTRNHVPRQWTFAREAHDIFVVVVPK